jgi:hypothetical protein
MLRVWMLLMGLGLALAQAPEPAPVLFRELYGKVSQQGLEFSEKLKALNGKRVQMTGYMAPPLKPKLDFFVLTKEPLETCPFCTDAADWPLDIVLVIMPKDKEVVATQRVLKVMGRLETGIKEDPQTGFISLIRIYADKLEEQ